MELIVSQEPFLASIDAVTRVQRFDTVRGTVGVEGFLKGYCLEMGAFCCLSSQQI